MKTSTQSHTRPRVVARLRSPVQVLWNAGCGLLFVVIVVGPAIEVGHLELGGVPFAVFSALFTLRASVLRIVVTDAELVAHSWWRTRRFAREDVADLRPAPYDGWWVRGSPSRIWSQLRLTTRDGHEHDLRAVITVTATGRARSFCDTLMGRLHGPARHAASRSPR